MTYNSTVFEKGHTPWNKGGSFSNESREKMSQSKMGIKQSEETKQKRSVALTGFKHKQVTCPHCGTTGGETSMKRWHFDNCKSTEGMKDTKICTKCNTEQPLSSFYVSNSKSNKRNPNSGYKSHCKACVKIRRREYYKTPEGHKYQIEKSWRDKGMLFTTEEYQELLEEQVYGCAICGVKSNKNGSRLCVDHNHTTGSIRGLLCHDCNTTLGKFNDEVEMFYKAIDYLEKYNEQD